MKRQEANFEILKILKNESDRFLTFLNTIIEQYPNQRFGQLICNYVCNDYTSLEPSNFTKFLMSELFITSDPFFEESSETLERFKKWYMSES